MKYIFLSLLFLTVISVKTSASDAKLKITHTEIKYKRISVSLKLQHKSTIDAVPCCLAIAQFTQNVLFLVVNSGTGNCMDISDTILMQQCIAYWSSYESVGEAAIEDALAQCEAIHGPNGMDCSNF